jgi:hypothetical protein
MKTTFLFLFLLCAAAAFAQGSVSSDVVLPPVPEHPAHAEMHAMATEHPLVGGGNGSETYTSAHGERPLWEFGPVKEETPLGDVARAYRKEKLTGKKAEITLEKQD